MTKILILEARFYEEIADNLVDAAISVLEAKNIEYERKSVPGAFELPAAASMAQKSGKYNGVIALGCVIRGETSHYDYVCGESARGLNDLAINFHLPLGYGIITAENKEQAMVRADKNQKNVGGRASAACLAMLQIKEEMGV